MRTKLRENFRLILFSLRFALKDTVSFEEQLADEQTKDINSSKMEVTSTTASFSANLSLEENCELLGRDNDCGQTSEQVFLRRLEAV